MSFEKAKYGFIDTIFFHDSFSKVYLGVESTEYDNLSKETIEGCKLMSVQYVNLSLCSIPKFSWLISK